MYTFRKYNNKNNNKTRKKIIAPYHMSPELRSSSIGSYDIIIIGGGIAGLYSAYLILKKNPKTKLLICEKSEILGGRVQTKYIEIAGEKINFEAGAGRFHINQQRIIRLIHELGLDTKIKKVESNFMFYDINRKENNISSPIIASNTEIVVGKVIVYSKLLSSTYLQNHSFLQVAKKILTKDEIKLLIDSFGYYTELVVMNAKDTINLILDHLNPSLQFFVLENGLSQIIEQLKKHILLSQNASILYNTEINSIRKHQEHMKLYYNKNQYFLCKKCICAIPRPQLQKIPIFRPLHTLLNKIVCSPLCRIYSVFKKHWNDGLPKLSTNNNLRMVITGKTFPSGVTTIMTSYTDNKYAHFWKKLYDKNNKNLQPEIVRLLKETTRRNVPTPINTYFYYWECGVGYWGIGANSEKISQKIIKPFSNINLYVCGEHYSANNQQWMEGALETSESVIKLL